MTRITRSAAFGTTSTPGAKRQRNTRPRTRPVSKTGGTGIPLDGFLRVAAAVPALALGNIEANLQEHLEICRHAAAEDVRLLVFPELSLTGYSLGDLLLQPEVHETAWNALLRLAHETRHLQLTLVVGLPLALDGKLYNVGAVVSLGHIHGLIPKWALATYGEFYEFRWFASSRDLHRSEIQRSGLTIPIGNDLLFALDPDGCAVLGVELCEDLWMPIPPSSWLTLSGATIIANLSASTEQVGKAEYRRQLVIQQSARAVCGYIYTSSGPRESTTDVVYGGHTIIAENGFLLAESRRFQRSRTVTVTDFDLQHLACDRRRITGFGQMPSGCEFPVRRLVRSVVDRFTPRQLRRPLDRLPFVPADAAERDRRTEDIFLIQTSGLIRRLESSGIKRVIIGLSGGLDSTLALLVAVRAMTELGLPLSHIHAYTLPGPGTSKRTRMNAHRLAQALRIPIEEVDISAGCRAHFSDLKHDPALLDVTYENVQARYRTMFLFNKANQLNGLVIGTGDLSETALGWCTYNGDHMSHYAVNVGIPKTLVRWLVTWVSGQPSFTRAADVLRDIVATPISPELLPGKHGAISQRTEQLIGPYELHDFFLYHFVRWGSGPRRIFGLACQTFSTEYAAEEIVHWLRIFIKRFFQNQWKRSVMPDGPKIGSVALSPRGDWRMPSDVEMADWMRELESLVPPRAVSTGAKRAPRPRSRRISTSDTE